LLYIYFQQEQEAEEISAEMLYYYDNKPTVDELMAKPDGLFHLLDEASKSNHPSDFILGGYKENSVSISKIFQQLFLSINI
jgi:Myosin heavy chain